MSASFLAVGKKLSCAARKLSSLDWYHHEVPVRSSLLEGPCKSTRAILPAKLMLGLRWACATEALAPAGRPEDRRC